MAAYNRYLKELQVAVSRKNSNQLRNLLLLNNADALEAIYEKRAVPNWDPSHACYERFPEVFAGMITYHLLALLSQQQGERIEAYQHAVKGLTDFLKAFREDTDFWLVDVMAVVAQNLKMLAEAADEEATTQGQPSTKYLADCVEQLRTCFRNVSQGKDAGPRKRITLLLINLQFKIFFRINSLQLCKTLTRAVETKGFPPLESFSMAQQVTFSYYRGRLHIFSEEYESAAEMLERAFANCHPSAPHNRARVLQYLLPVKMLIGQLPTRQLIETYGMQQYLPIVEAMQSGSIREFDDAMTANQFHFIQSGVYLLLEKLRNAVYRRLFRRVAGLWATQLAPDPSKGHQLPLVYFQKALKWQGEEVSYEEVECIVANLIFQKYIKGYISHKLRTVVLSKQDAFPPLDEIQLQDF